MSDPLRSRLCPSMTHIAQLYIYVIGGMNPAKLQEVLSDVDCYDVRANEWLVERKSNLQEARYWHSSCTLASTHMYTFCGYGIEGKRLESIERIEHSEE